MKSLSSRNILIGCGVLVVIGACVGVILTISGVGALAAIFGPDPQGLSVEVAITPTVIRPGEAFDLVVTAGNVGSRPLTVSQVALPQSLLDGALLKGVSPPDQGRSQLADSTGFSFSQPVSPGEQARITFSFQALTAGDFGGDLAVAVGVRRKQTPVRVVISPAQGPPLASQTEAPPPEGAIPYQAVVQIIALVEEDGELYEGWTGSGSIISPDGLILTNAHVVLSDKYYQVADLVVALTEAEDRPPAPRYYAQVLQADEALDIAVIRTDRDLDGNPVDNATLDLPTVPLGDSNSLKLGDRLYILGYPGIGGETITLTGGEVSGFTAESGRGERAFIKTSATIAGGNSGGLAANARGELIGVPTQLGYGGDDQYVDCRVLADTNRDGIVNEEDNCVPTGGFINALRPLELALPLIEAARRGEVAIQTIPLEEAEMPAGGSILYQDDFSDPASGWDDFSDEEISVGYVQGRYHLGVKVDNFLVWQVAGERLGDVVVTARAEPVTPTGEADFGLICRYQDADNYYALEISEDGYFTIWKMQAGEFISLVDWETSPDVPQDGSEVNLQAACIGDSLLLAADNVVLAEARDDSFARGDVGIIAGTWDTPGLVVAFDDFVVRAP